MTLVTTHYRTWTSRRRRRAGATAQEIAPASLTTVTDPGTFQSLAFPTVAWVDGNGQMQSANFAFWAVTGASAQTPGSVTANPQLSVNVGADPLTAVAWYLPIGGDGNGGPGWDIDAFDVNAGQFVLDDFVNVTSDPSLTAAANWDGYVPTANAETIEAYDHIAAGPFSMWDLVTTPATQSNRTVQLAQRSSGTGFAFYQRPMGVMPKRPREYDVWTWVSRGVMVDGGGPTGNGPIGPWNPDFLALIAGVQLANGVGRLQQELRGEVLNIASKQVMQSAEKIVGSFKTFK
jgi:hypothetical protein